MVRVKHPVTPKLVPELWVVRALLAKELSDPRAQKPRPATVSGYTKSLGSRPESRVFWPLNELATWHPGPPGPLSFLRIESPFSQYVANLREAGAGLVQFSDPIAVRAILPDD